MFGKSAQVGVSERGWQEMVDEVLGEEGKGVDWLKKLDDLREGRMVWDMWKCVEV